jgi:hypothetical protein
VSEDPVRVLAKEFIGWERPPQGVDSICVFRRRAQYPENVSTISLGDASRSPPGIKVLRRGYVMCKRKPKQQGHRIVHDLKWVKAAGSFSFLEVLYADNEVRYR